MIIYSKYSIDQLRYHGAPVSSCFLTGHLQYEPGPYTYEVPDWSFTWGTPLNTAIITGKVISTTAVIHTLAVNVTNGTAVCKDSHGSTVTLPVSGTEGSVYTVEIVPDAGFDFKQWSDGVTTNPRQVRLDTDVTLSASCSMDITLDASAVWGTVTAAKTDGTPVTLPYVTDVFGEQIVLTVTADAHCHFKKWDDNSVINPRTVTLIADTTLVATCIDNFLVSAGTVGDGNVTADVTLKDGTILTNVPLPYEAPDEETKIVLTANPLDSTFSRWINDDGTIFSANQTVTIDPILKHYSIRAYFTSGLLTLTSTQAGSTVFLDASEAEGLVRNVEYSLDGGPWTVLPQDSSQKVVVENGKKIKFRCETGGQPFNSFDGWLRFDTYGSFTVSGSVMSLLSETMPSEIPVSEGCFFDLFNENTGITHIQSFTSSLNTQPFCYYEMFHGCTNLVSVAPGILSSVTGQLTEECYAYMFSSCENLANVPSLPSTQLGKGCYNSMFEECSSITVAPALPATKLCYECYNGMLSGTGITSVPYIYCDGFSDGDGSGALRWMFGECHNLTNIEDINIELETLPHSFFSSTFYGCNSLVNPLKNVSYTNVSDWTFYNTYHGCTELLTPDDFSLPATTMQPHCYHGMFSGCSKWEWCELPATTLAESCYEEMFYGCSSFYWLWSQAKDITPTNCIRRWMYEVSTESEDKCKFYCYSSPNYPVGASGVPSNFRVYCDDCIELHVGSGYTARVTLSVCPTGKVDVSKNGCFGDTANTIIGWDGSEFSSSLSRVYVRATAGSESIAGFGGNYTMCRGHVGSLIDYHNYDTVEMSESQFYKALPEFDEYYGLFSNSNLTTLHYFSLPSVSLKPYCFASMFEGTPLDTRQFDITNILPYTELANNCYDSMFASCSLVTSAPLLPATVMKDECYNYMFYKSGLTTSIDLSHVTSLAYCCFNGMYYEAPVSDINIPSVTTLAERCYSMMYEGTRITYIPPLPATTLAPYCYSGMFSDCELLNIPIDYQLTAPLEEGCYEMMFAGCKFSEVPQNLLPVETLAQSCYSDMFNGCRNLVKAPLLPAPLLVADCYGSMFYNCESLNEIRASFTNAVEVPNALSVWCLWDDVPTHTGTLYLPVDCVPHDSSSGCPKYWTLNSPHTLNFSASNGTAYGYLDDTPIASGITLYPGRIVTLSVVARSGYTFDQWNDGNTENPRTYIMPDSNVNLIANCTVNMGRFYFTAYNGTVTATVDGTPITSGSKVAYGKVVVLTDTPNADYRFKQWSTGATVNPLSVTMGINDVTINAENEPDTYALNFSATNGNVTAYVDGIPVASGSRVLVGKEVTLTDTPFSGYQFYQWSDATTNNPYVFTMPSASVSLTATNTVKTYALSYTATNCTITAKIDGLITYDNPAQVQENKAVSLTVNPSSSTYHFTQWTDGNTENPRNFSMPANAVSLKCVCEETAYPVVFSASHGTILATVDGNPISSGSYVVPGKTIQFTDVPDAGYHFKKWNDGSTVNPRSVVMPSELLNMTAIDERDSAKIYFVNPEHGAIDCGYYASGVYHTVSSGDQVPAGASCNIHISIETNWKFVQWSNGSTYNPYYWTMGDEDVTFTATVAKVENTLTYSGKNCIVTATVDGATVPSGSLVWQGKQVVLSASVSAPLHFVQWSDGNTDNPRTLTMPGVPVTLEGQAEGAKKLYFSCINGEITATADGNPVSSGDDVVPGSTVKMFFTPEPNYRFTKWSDGHTDNVREFAMPQDDLTLVAMNKATTYLVLEGPSDSFTSFSYSHGAGIEYTDDFLQWYPLAVSTAHEVKNGKLYVAGKMPDETPLSGFSGNFTKVSGPLTSLVNYDKEIMKDMNTFFDTVGLFEGCTSLVDASELTFNFPYCGWNQYKYMFKDCENLVSGPAFTHTNFNWQQPFEGFFMNCKSLVGPIDISNITYLRENCKDMFKGAGINRKPTDNMIVYTHTDNQERWQSSYQYIGLDGSYWYTTIKEGDENMVWLYFNETKERKISIRWAGGGTITYSTERIPNDWTALTSDTLTLVDECSKIALRGSSVGNQITVLTATNVDGSNDTSLVGLSGTISALRDYSTYNTCTYNNFQFQNVSDYHNFGYKLKNLVNAKGLNFPSTITMKNQAYQAFFEYCTALRFAPAYLGHYSIFAGNNGFFRGCTALTDISYMVIEDHGGGESCMAEMFKGCSNLTYGPDINITGAGTNGCNAMFYGCSNLISTERVRYNNGTTGDSQFSGMYWSCSKLKKISPYLRSTTLGAHSYQNMFGGCRSLEGPIVISYSGTPTTDLAYNMFTGAGIGRSATPTNKDIDVMNSHAAWITACDINTTYWNVV